MKALVSRLRRSGCLLATVESCTGGDLASAITDVAGSSEVFWGGYVTYANSAKVSAVGVSRRALARAGAVSESVAREMAEGGLARMKRAASGSLLCVSTTGIAGPSGATPGKPVGLCYVACATSFGKTRVRRVAPARGSRLANKRRFTRAAVELVLEALESRKPGRPKAR